MLGIYTEELEKYIEELEARLEEYENPNNAISDDLDHNKWLENEAEALRQEIENLRASEQEIRDIFAEIEKYNRKIEDYTKRMENAPTEHLKNGYGQLIEDFKKYQKELLNRINGKMPESVMAAINERLEGNKEDNNEKETDENKVEEDRKEENKEEVKEEPERERLKRSIEEKEKRKKEIEDRLKELGVEVKEPKEEEVKIEKQPRPIKVTPEQNENIETNAKKVRKSAYEILNSVIRDEDGKPYDFTITRSNVVEKSRLSVTNTMKDLISHHNTIYNVAGVGAGLLFTAGSIAYKGINKFLRIFHPSDAKTYDEIAKKLDNLSDEEMEILYKELTGSEANSMRSFQPIMPLVMQKLSEYIEKKKNAPLRLEISSLYTDIIGRYDKIEDLKVKLEETKDPQERKQIEAEIKELSEGATEKVKKLLEDRRQLDRNMHGDGMHSLAEISKAIKSQQNQQGKIFSKRTNLKDAAVDEFNNEMEAKIKKLNKAIDAGDDLGAIKVFVENEMYKQENTKQKRTIFGMAESGSYKYKVMPEMLDFRNDPLLRYFMAIGTEVAIGVSIYQNVSNMMEAKRVESEYIAQKGEINRGNHDINAGNQYNEAVAKNVRAQGGQIQNITDPNKLAPKVEQQLQYDNVNHQGVVEYGNAFDPKNPIGSSGYRLADTGPGGAHDTVETLYRINHGITNYSKNLPADGIFGHVQHIVDQTTKTITSQIPDIITKFMRADKFYKGRFDYDPQIQVLQDIVNNPTSFMSDMVSSFRSVYKIGTQLTETTVAKIPEIQTLLTAAPDIQPVIFPTIMAFLNATVMGDNNRRVQEITKGKNIEDLTEEEREELESIIAVTNGDLENILEESARKKAEREKKKEMNTMLDEDDEKTDDYEYQAAM
ncbi:MAG: hypothetical protein IKG58_01525 [Bacilli bacterium]|nr:hypothetical protein [Bacilli bacterium]